MNILKFKITDKFFFSETKKEIRFFQAGQFLWRRKTEAPIGFNQLPEKATKSK